jgi:hypothetical protein
MLLYMLAAARLGRGWYDHRNHHHRRVYRQCQNPDREFAQGSLLRFLATRQQNKPALARRGCLLN